jgi:uncharacterized protein
VLLTVKVKPGSQVDSIEVGTEVLVRIRERAHDGKANGYLTEFLGQLFDVPKTSIKITRGETSKIKQVSIPLEQDIVEMTLALFRK